MVKVYIVERGLYEDAYILGVFSSLELAFAYYPGEEWLAHGEGWWTNSKDGAGHLEISEEELDPSPLPESQQT